VPEQDEVETPNPSFGREIQRLRRASGLTQRQAAAQLGIDFTYLSKLENDRGEAAGEDTVRRMADLYNADAERLLALAGKVPPELRHKALEDQRFATLLRKLPNLSADKLKKIYRNADIPDEKP
jgi:HTH-type transcriptional regulator, competence development regulator